MTQIGKSTQPDLNADSINNERVSITNYKTDTLRTKDYKSKPIVQPTIKDKVSVVFNYSKRNLTSAMERLLNQGLNFAILPLKLKC